MMESQTPTGVLDLQENFEDFFEYALSGFIITDSSGLILRANKKIAEWVGSTSEGLKGKRFSDLLAIGGKIYFETHLWPLLRMQGFFDEVVLEITDTTQQKSRVMVHAIERRDMEGNPLFIRYTILKASDRLHYEQNLQEAKKNAEKELIRQKEKVTLREQLIAVLGHDLRNPLSAVAMAVELMAASPDEDNSIVIDTLVQSTNRMRELVNNIMDFARTRLGEGIVINRQDTLLKPILDQVVSELKLIYPERLIITSFQLSGLVNCDPYRVAQLFSNLLANALTHGDSEFPVEIHAIQKQGNFELSVCNRGTPIPKDLQEHLFDPFEREASNPNQHGLGLGLYICAEIAHAHNGTLRFISDEKETCFTFAMDL